MENWEQLINYDFINIYEYKQDNKKNRTEYIYKK